MSYRNTFQWVILTQPLSTLSFRSKPFAPGNRKRQ